MSEHFQPLPNPSDDDLGKERIDERRAAKTAIMNVKRREWKYVHQTQIEATSSPINISSSLLLNIHAHWQTWGLMMTLQQLLL
jgi:hypothetical protein